MTATQIIMLIAKFGIALPLVVAFCVWLCYRAYRNADEPKALVIKWMTTLAVGGLWYWYIAPRAGRGGAYSIDSLLVTLICGLVMAITWRHSIGAVIAKPFMMFYEEDREIEPQPYYSVAQARCKRGQYAEALAEVRRQLGRFPTDFTGQLLLAEIQAEKLHDLASAELTLKEICRQPNHPPRNIAFAMNTLADWKLKYARDADAAREALESIRLLLPNTEFATLAEQRIAHLRQPEDRTVSEPIRFQPRPNSPNLGLLSSIQHLAPREVGAEERSTELIRQLELYPQDHDARERLALLYADEFHRLDLAREQLEQLIAAPNQPARQIIRWLNLVADLQIREGGDLGAAKQTLERLIALFPENAAARLARNRIDLLPLELKAKEKSQTVRLGSYEQNIGLKR